MLTCLLMASSWVVVVYKVVAYKVVVHILACVSCAHVRVHAHACACVCAHARACVCAHARACAGASFSCSWRLQSYSR